MMTSHQAMHYLNFMHIVESCSYCISSLPTYRLLFPALTCTMMCDVMTTRITFLSWEVSHLVSSKQAFFPGFSTWGCNRMIGGVGQTGTPLGVCGLGEGITSLLEGFNLQWGHGIIPGSIVYKFWHYQSQVRIRFYLHTLRHACTLKKINHLWNMKVYKCHVWPAVSPIRDGFDLWQTMHAEGTAS
jgi:hypothetical protein